MGQHQAVERPMRQKWWRSWPVAVAVAAGLIALGVLLTVAWLDREQPNYTQIEDGLYLGGYVREPPRGTRAVLNLCEVEDPYTTTVHRWEPIADTEPAPTLDWLREQVGFIKEQRDAGRTVFVHCR